MKLCKECLQVKPETEFYAGRIRCKICWLAGGKKWRRENPERLRAYWDAWGKRNPDWVKYSKVKSKEWYKANSKLHLSRVRHWQLKESAPKFGQDGIAKFYINCPKGYEVDHIIPINGKDVSGLHVIWNLQYLTKSQNRHKSKKFSGVIECLA